MRDPHGDPRRPIEEGTNFQWAAIVSWFGCSKSPPCFATGLRRSTVVAFETNQSPPGQLPNRDRSTMNRWISWRRSCRVSTNAHSTARSEGPRRRSLKPRDRIGAWRARTWTRGPRQMVQDVHPDQEEPHRHPGPFQSPPALDFSPLPEPSGFDPLPPEPEANADRLRP